MPVSRRTGNLALRGTCRRGVPACPGRSEHWMMILGVAWVCRLWSQQRLAILQCWVVHILCLCGIGSPVQLVPAAAALAALPSRLVPDSPPSLCMRPLTVQLQL